MITRLSKLRGFWKETWDDRRDDINKDGDSDGGDWDKTAFANCHFGQLFFGKVSLLTTFCKSLFPSSFFGNWTYGQFFGNLMLWSGWSGRSDDMHLENIWFSWFKASSIIVIEKRWYITPVRDGGRKVEKRAVFWKTRNRKNIWHNSGVALWFRDSNDKNDNDNNK